MEEDSKKFGDFEEVEENKGEEKGREQQITIRVRMPRKGELIGIVRQRLGANRMEVKATDGKVRNSRVPGRFKRRFWLRTGDFVIIKPWEDDDDKADIIYQYKGSAKHQVKKLKLPGFEEEF